jgi:phosphoribosylformimino-5-aminoimidazole carboxamide ribotide isomerase
MRIIPVVDLKAGEAVRAVGGVRRDYRPLVTPLAESSRPLAVAQGYRRHLGLSELYVADLDAIEGAEPNHPVLAALQADGFRLWVDAGVREVQRARSLAEAGVETIVVGLETIAGPTALGQTAALLGPRLVFSLDLRDAAPLGGRRGWQSPDAWTIADEARALGVRRMLILDLARIGRNEGCGTEALCARLAARYPDLEVSAGGGVRGLNDLRRLENCGVRAALVASAFHERRIGRADLDALTGP